MDTRNILIIDNHWGRRLNPLYNILYSKQDSKLHYLNNEALLKDRLFLKKFNVAILNILKREYVNNLSEKSIPSIVMVGSKERHLVSLLKNAQGIIKKDSPFELLASVEAVEKGGFYLSNELKKDFFQQLHLHEQSLVSEGLKDLPALLTKMEMKVVEELISDKTNQQIADTLYLSKRTVEYYIASSMQKLQVNSRVGLAVKITRASLIGSASLYGREFQENRQFI
ncbi:response regulator transcription factor [Peribacillus frigoritolerans]|uniref:response regulator transcription factor n=1 Tax=Peribacillus frigoritolerans TaxID=450367 RepID=UPI0023DADDDC|nr:LuxR C-terminal-related transcriptional regulator [Peribacillus frigoritolerans]MDF1999850.1 LuxR C-terminal-related transcriptional regulator [Peribacillus frigoritolerans]